MIPVLNDDQLISGLKDELLANLVAVAVMMMTTVQTYLLGGGNSTASSNV